MSKKRQNNEKLPTVSKKKRNNPENHEESESDDDTEMVDSIVNRSGKINKIILKNFMCHSNLIIEFNKNVNLLVGNNGSGKSAVLTALIVGLGSKSRATSRCTNIAQLIKRGETSGSVNIHIANNCDQGYDRETYGNEIIVQRTFTSDGSSSYRIKKSSGQVVSSSRKDLMKILLFMNIQVDNPVCVLNQDASRAFLKESDPKNRFKFFLKATQIDTVIEKLNDCNSHYASAKKQLEYQKNVLVSLKEEVDKIQTKFESLQSIGFLKKALSKYKLELAWLKVENEETLQEDIKATLNKYQQIYDDLMKKVNDRQQGEQGRKARCELLAAQIAELKEEMKGDLGLKEQMRKKISKDEESRNETNRQLLKIDKRLGNNQKNIRQLEHDMSESTESERDRIALAKEANQKKIENFTQSKGECESIKANNSRDIEMLRNTKNKIEEKVSHLRDKKVTLLRSADKIKAEIRQCETSKNSLSLYGAFMPELVNVMEQMSRKGEFRQLPRGPLGKYIEVADEKFKAPVEALLGLKLLSFCVNDAKDRDVLNRLFAKMSSKYPDVRKCSVITTKFNGQMYDVTNGKVQSVPNAYSVLDVIKCSEPVVLNALIDYCKIERILFTDDDTTGFNITSSVENVPHNLLKVIVLNPPTEMFPAPNLRTYALEKRPARYLQVNMKERKEHLLNEIQDLHDRLREAKDQIDAEEMKKNELSKTLSEKVSLGDKLDDRLRSVVQSIEQLSKIEFPGENERQMLQTELDDLKQARIGLEEEQSTVKVHLDEIQAVIQVKRNEMAMIEENIQKKTDKIDEKQIEIYNENDFIAEDAANASAHQRQVAKYKGQLEKLQQQEQECVHKLTNLTQVASNLADRIPVQNSENFLMSKIKETEKIIKTVADSKDSLEEVEEVLQLKTTEYSEKKELVENLELTLLKLKSSRQNRYQWLVKFKSHVSLRVQHEFNKIMKLRSYDGTITIDHQKETLELSVIPRDQHIANSVSSTNCLSGGERSFSTVAFLLALWSVVDSPFYFLDEYDVYTDAINRYYMTTLLLKEARKKKYRQYTFLTPQDMSDYAASDDLSIQKLADPVRK